MPWQSQIRTNLEDESYGRHLKTLVRDVPGALCAALVNVRFREICAHGPRAAIEQRERDALVELTVSLFGGASAALSADVHAFTALGPVQTAYLVFREETLLLRRLEANQLLVLMTSASLNQGACLAILQTVAAQLSTGSAQLESCLDASIEVLAGMVIDLRSAAIVDRCERLNGSVAALDDDLAATLVALCSQRPPPGGLRVMYDTGQPIEIRRAEIEVPGRRFHWARMQFDPEHLLFLSVEAIAARGLVWSVMREREVEIVRLWVDGLLSYGVPSTMSPFPQTQREFLEIVDQLRNLDENDLLGRLDIGGFANYTVGEGEDMQRCMECIYYLPNRRWCDLPELPLPVEPDWWCRLWKI